MSSWLSVLLDVHSGCFVSVRSLLHVLLFAWMEE